MVQGGAAPPMFSLLAHLLKMIIAWQCCIADKTQGKSYLLANLAQSKSISWQSVTVHQTNNFFSFTLGYSLKVNSQIEEVFHNVESNSLLKHICKLMGQLLKGALDKNRRE